MDRGRSDQLWNALGRFRQRILDRMQPGLAGLEGLDLTLAQSITLQQIAGNGPLSIGALQTRLARAQATTSQLVSQLARRGLVDRLVDPADARRTLVALSPKGRRQMERLEAIRRQGFADVVGALPTGVQRQLVEALEATLAALGPGKDTP